LTPDRVKEYPVTLVIYLLLSLILLFLNGFFVLAEFSAVRLRPTRVEELVAQGNKTAKLVQHIQSNLDNFLPVFQVGITLCSIALGFVGQAMAGEFVQNLLGVNTRAASIFTFVVEYGMISFLHILLGELVPKQIAIRKPEGSALLSSRPLLILRGLLLLPIWLLNGSARFLLRMIGLSPDVKEERHSEDELRIILARHQSTGMMSFRRLLFLENIFDLSEVKVRDAMRGRDGVKVLRLGVPWEENFKIVRESRLSRFPLVGEAEFPLGIVHIKDLLYEGPDKMAAVDLKRIARPYLTAVEDMPLENLLGDFQRQRGHLAVVKNAEGKWSGIISLEDIIEEVVGTIEDEFEAEPRIFMADALTPGRIVLGIDGSGLEEAIGQIFGRIAPAELPLPVDRIVKAVLERERAMSTYLGNGLAIPHARLEGMDKPVLIFGRSDAGIPIKGREEKACFMFILLTPSGSPRVQVRLLARICGLIDSEYVVERLRKAETHAAVLEAIRAAEPMTQ
jgi:CBS domain containing-hemolysin-like protein/mannitol/fructose-specific phosphotransferase system IIA component (Ntr-type)